MPPSRPGVMTRADAARLPGSIDDPLRALTAIPGVASVNDLKAEIRLRGGNPEDTLFRIDGVQLVNPYHFRGASGSTASLNPDAFDQLEVVTSGLGPEVGDTVSGVVELAPSERGGSGNFFQVGMGTVTGRITSGGPLPQGGSWLLSARYSNLELYRGLFGDETVNIPDFGDVLLRGRQPLTAGSDLVVGALGSSSGQEADDENGDFSSDLQASTWLTYVGVDTALGGGRTLMARLSQSTFRQQFESVETPLVTAYDERTQLRVELRGARANGDGWMAGMEGGVGNGGIDGRLEELEEPPPPFSAASTRMAAFGSYTLRPSARWSVVTGGRTDWDSRGGFASFQPRIRADYMADQDWSLHFAAGRYAQFPRLEQEYLAFGEPLGIPTADELSAGLQFGLPHHLSAQVTVFTRKLRDVTGELVNKSPALGETNGRFDYGRTQGLEFSLRRARGRVQTWLAFTALQAEMRRDGLAFPRNGDQPYRLDLSTAYLMGAHWELLGRYQAAAGLPYSGYIPTGDGERVLGLLNNARLPATSRLDLRISYERRWDLLTTRYYLEINNILNTRNIREQELRWDKGKGRYEMDESISLPRIPAFGIEILWG
jgi:TonB dependent receptor-like, beta-barrel/TonB-dependent Receptor Plug Domain